MQRQVIITDWRTGTTKAAYVDLGPGRALPGHGRVSSIPGQPGGMSKGGKQPGSAFPDTNGGR